MSSEKKTEQEQGDLVYYLEHDELWPWFPMLPVERYFPNHSWPQHGVVWARHPTVVILKNLFNLPARPFSFEEIVAEYPTETYETPAAMAAAGWVVD